MNTTTHIPPAFFFLGRFSHAANAFENCNPKYKAVFAEPRSSQRSTQNERSSSHRYDDQYNSYGSGAGNSNHRGGASGAGTAENNFNFTSNSNANAGETQLSVICSSLCNQDQLWRLFDIIPGLDYCQITGESRNSNYATVVYNNASATSYAREKLHGLEYPPGERLIIKPVSDLKPSNADGLFAFDTPGSTKDVFCSVKLPDAQPMASSTAQTAQRCFVVCVPKALPQKMLLSVFSRFGDLIDVYMLPNKNCGYAKYASEDSASRAIETLNGAEVYGVRLKVGASMRFF